MRREREVEGRGERKWKRGRKKGEKKRKKGEKGKGREGR